MSRDNVGVKALAWPACPLAVVLATILLAAVLCAQTSNGPTAEPPPELTPTVPSPPSSTDAAAALTAPAGRPVAGWDYGVSVGVGHDSNIGFRVADGPSSLAMNARGILGRTFTGRRGDLRLDGGGSWYGYSQQSLLNRFNGYLGLDGEYRASLATTWETDAYYHLGYSDQSLVLSDQGVLLPLVRTRTAGVHIGMTRVLGEKTSLRVSGHVTSVQFDQQDAGSSGLVDGLALRGSVALRRKLGQRDSGAVAYSLGASLGRLPPGSLGGGSRPFYLTHYGSLQWEHEATQRSAFRLEAGASYTPEAQTAGLAHETSFFGGAGYNLRLRHADLRLFARRHVTPAFGLGVSRAQTTLGGAASLPIGREWTFRVTARHSIPDTPPGAPFQYGTADDFHAVLWREITRHFAVSGEGRYRRRGARDLFPEIDSYQVGIFLSFVGPSKVESGRIGRF